MCQHSTCCAAGWCTDDPRRKRSRHHPSVLQAQVDYMFVGLSAASAFSTSSKLKCRSPHPLIPSSAHPFFRNGQRFGRTPSLFGCSCKSLAQNVPQAVVAASFSFLLWLCHTPASSSRSDSTGRPCLRGPLAAPQLEQHCCWQRCCSQGPSGNSTKSLHAGSMSSGSQHPPPQRARAIVCELVRSS